MRETEQPAWTAGDLSAPHAVADIDAWGGFSILTYPEDPTHRWQYWEEDFAPDGIEIINVTSYFRASSIWKRLDWALFSIFNRYYYISGFTAPEYALERWDELLRRAPVWGFYAANAHGGFPVTEELTGSPRMRRRSRTRASASIPSSRTIRSSPSAAVSSFRSFVPPASRTVSTSRWSRTS